MTGLPNGSVGTVGMAPEAGSLERRVSYPHLVAVIVAKSGEVVFFSVLLVFLGRWSHNENHMLPR